MVKKSDLQQKARGCAVYIFWQVFLFLYRLLFLFQREKNSCLVISRTDHLGDMLCSLPMLKEFCAYAKKKGWKTILLAAPANEYIARSMLDFDEIILIDKNRSFRDIKYRLQCFAKLYRLKIALFVNCVDNDETAFYGAFSFAKKIIATTSDGPVFPLLDFLSRKYTALFKYEKSQHIFQRNSGLFHAATGECIPEKVQDITAEAKKLFLPETAKFLKGKKYILLFPGASFFLTCYPAEKYAIILEKLLDAFPAFHIVIAGSPEDEKLEKIIREHLKKYLDSVLFLCGRTTLENLIPLTAKAALVLGNDSGGIHLAEAVHTPSVALVSGATYGYYMPNPCYKYTRFLYHFQPCFQCQGDCSVKKGERPCLSGITPEEVFSVAKRILEEKEVCHE